MSDPHTTGSRRALRARTLLAAAVTATALVLLSGCIVFTDGRTHAAATEGVTRANIVVFRKASTALRDWGAARGVPAARSVIVERIPRTITIPRSVWTTLCALASPFCIVGITRAAQTIMSQFRSDIRRRADFWEALSEAGRRDRCFAWTFVPSRNLTTKGQGTSGCRLGTLG